MSVVETGCNGFCAKGPVIRVLPEGIFYQLVKDEDIPEILEEWTDSMALSEKAHDMLVEWTSNKTNAELDDLFTKGRIPYGIVSKLSDLLKDPQTEAREMFVDVDHSLGFTYTTISSPMKFSETPLKINRAAPTFGQDTNEVLSKILKYDEEKIAELRKSGALCQ